MKQTTLASLSYQSKNEQARRETFPAEMDQLVPWTEPLALIEPF